ncbi:DNA-binding GntR family transcriptional regulator [Neorhizobium galegae]|nr:DNA-binding GntR family transcriptional regulator [Neorhizobium galegae]
MLLRPLAERLGVSITPVREALLQLVSEQALLILSDRSVAVPQMDLARLREIRDLRVELEGIAVEAAMPNLGDADVDHVSLLLKKLYEAKTHADGLTTMSVRHQFHFHLYQFAQKPILTSSIENLWVQAGPMVHAELVAPTILRSVESTGLLKGLRRRDALMTKVALQYSIIEMFDRAESLL